MIAARLQCTPEFKDAVLPTSNVSLKNVGVTCLSFCGFSSFFREMFHTSDWFLGRSTLLTLKFQDFFWDCTRLLDFNFLSDFFHFSVSFSTFHSFYLKFSFFFCYSHLKQYIFRRFQWRLLGEKNTKKAKNHWIWDGFHSKDVWS